MSNIDFDVGGPLLSDPRELQVRSLPRRSTSRSVSEHDASSTPLLVDSPVDATRNTIDTQPRIVMAVAKREPCTACSLFHWLLKLIRNTVLLGWLTLCLGFSVYFTWLSFDVPSARLHCISFEAGSPWHSRITAAVAQQARYQEPFSESDMALPLMDVLHRYRPVVVFDSHERYFPIPFQYFVAHSSLVWDKMGLYIAEGTLTLLDLVRTTAPLIPGLEDADYPIVVPNDAILAGMPYVDVPLIGDVRNRTFHDGRSVYEIRYLFLEAENGPFDVVWNLFGLGEHRGDLEHITVRVDADSGKMISVFYACHGYEEGMWVDVEDLDFFNGTHPVVYSAHFSHASYPTCGTMRRRGWFGFFPHDHCDAAGMIWFPTNVVPLMTGAEYYGINANNTFYRYKGYWGSVHTGGATLQRWWIDEW